MTISGIQKTVQSTERFNISIDGRYHFTLTLESIAHYQIRIGQTITDEQYTKLQEIAELEKKLPRIMNWMLIRQRYSRESILYFRKIGLPDELIGSYVKKYQSMKLIDDQKYSQNYADKALTKGKSMQFVRNYLISKGIDSEIVANIESDVDTEEQLRKLIAKLRRKKIYHDDIKLLRYLVNHGYDYQESKNAIKAS